MKKIKLTIFFLLSVCITYSQRPKKIVFNYYKSECSNRIKQNSLRLQILKQGASYTFIPSEDTAVVFSSNNPKILDTLISNTSFGPYKFKKVKDKILFSKRRDDGIYAYKDLYLLKKNKSFLVPNLLSQSADSYYIKGVFMGDTVIVIDKKPYQCYKFFESYNDWRKSISRIVFLSKELLIPLRIEYYNDFLLKDCRESIQINSSSASN